MRRRVHGSHLQPSRLGPCNGTAGSASATLCSASATGNWWGARQRTARRRTPAARQPTIFGGSARRHQGHAARLMSLLFAPLIPFISNSSPRQMNSRRMGSNAQARRDRPGQRDLPGHRWPRGRPQQGRPVPADGSRRRLGGSQARQEHRAAAIDHLVNWPEGPACPATNVIAIRTMEEISNESDRGIGSVLGRSDWLSLSLGGLRQAPDGPQPAAGDRQHSAVRMTSGSS